MKFAKYHALGNDYLVIDPRDLDQPLTQTAIRRICHRHFGIGSDGILLGPAASTRAGFALRIFNPDGSEAGKSGNGLRIFSRYLFDRQRVGAEPFTVETPGGVVRCIVMNEGRQVQVEMGRVSFWSDAIPVAGPRREVVKETLTAGDRDFEFTAATIGNPHCVIPLETISESLARQYGPLLETHPAFPERTNVQFMKVIDRTRVQLEIWERGAGYTLASGSSSSAAVAVARKLGLVDSRVTVQMPGGDLRIELDDAFAVLMTGPVTRVGEGILAAEMFENA